MASETISRQSSFYYVQWQDIRYSTSGVFVNLQDLPALVAKVAQGDDENIIGHHVEGGQDRS